MPAAAIAHHGATPGPHATRWSVTGLLLVLLAHAGVLGGLAALTITPLPAPPPPPTTLLVQLLAPTPATPERPRALPQPVKRPPVSRPAPTPLALTLPTAAPSPAAAVPQASPARAAPADPAPPPAAAAAVAAVPAAPLTPARFDADYLHNPAPAYPVLSRRLGEEGQVVLRVFVEASGRPSQVDIRRTSGSPRLDQAAQDAVWRWTFVAARQGPEAVGAWVLVPLVFNLRG